MDGFHSGNRLVKWAVHLINLGKETDSDVLILLRIEIHLI